jgi:MFS transporter, NNP family, nitrate/nitrite transporter
MSIMRAAALSAPPAASAHLHLNAAQKGLMVAVPVLAGAMLRPIMGILVDRLKPKKAGIIAQIIVISGLPMAWIRGIHYRSH